MNAGKGQANLVLGAAFLLFAIAVGVKYFHPGSEAASLFLTVSEAGLAGGVADWFAVTALFKKPLGFPYHTAIIPRNRGRIVYSLAEAVEKEFLSKESIQKRLADTKLVEAIITQADSVEITPLARRAAAKVVDIIVQAVGRESVSRYIQRVLKLILKRQSIAPQAAAAVEWALKEGKTRVIYEAIISEAMVMARDPNTRAAIFQYLETIKNKTAKKNWLSSMITGFMERIDGINLTDAADILQQELIANLEELLEENHPIWLWFETELTMAADKLKEPEWALVVDTWKNGLLGRLELGHPLAALIRATTEALTVDSSKPEETPIYRDYVIEWLTKQAVTSWEQFKTDREMREHAEAYLKLLVGKIVENEHGLIGQVVTAAVNKMTDEDLNRFIEDKAGDDLEWIRINGVIVGGIAGLLLAVFLRYVYDPYIVPTIRGLIE